MFRRNQKRCRTCISEQCAYRKARRSVAGGKNEKIFNFNSCYNWDLTGIEKMDSCFWKHKNRHCKSRCDEHFRNTSDTRLPSPRDSSPINMAGVKFTCWSNVFIATTRLPYLLSIAHGIQILMRIKALRVASTDCLPNWLWQSTSQTISGARSLVVLVRSLIRPDYPLALVLISGLALQM